MNNSDDATLWVAGTSGTGAAFGELYLRHRAAVFRKAYSKLRNVQDAEDVVATVFLEAWRNRAKVRIVGGSLLPWLLVTTHYVSLNHDRSRRRHRRLLASLPDPTVEPDHAEAVMEELQHEQRASELREILQRLRPRDQVIVDLCLVEELSLAEVATVLDIPIGTVKSRLNRVRRKLQADLLQTSLLERDVDEPSRARSKVNR